MAAGAVSHVSEASRPPAWPVKPSGVGGAAVHLAAIIVANTWTSFDGGWLTPWAFAARTRTK